MSNMEAFNKIMSEVGKQLNEETITAIKAALEAKDEQPPFNDPAEYDDYDAAVRRNEGKA